MSHTTNVAGRRGEEEGAGGGRSGIDTLIISTFISLCVLCCNSWTGILMPTLKLYVNM